MADMCDHFRQFMVEGTELNQAKLEENIDQSVMMVTALSPVIGYDQALRPSPTTPSTMTSPSSRPPSPTASPRSSSTRSSTRSR